jgi:hypothetical protein
VSERLAAAMGRLRSRDRWRRLAGVSWAALGGAGLAALSWLTLAHAGVQDIPALAATGVAGLAAALFARRARRHAAPDALLARAVDRAAELPDTALTVIRPFGATAAGITAANRDRVESALGGAPPARLRAWRVPRWPLAAALAVLLLLLLLPDPPRNRGDGPQAPSAAASSSSAGGGQAPPRSNPNDGGGGSAEAGGSGVGENPNEREQDTPPPPKPDEPPPEDEKKNQPPEPPKRPGSGTGPLYQDPERTKVGIERVTVKPLFDETDGSRRTVLVPDAPTPPTDERTRRNPTGRPPAEIDRTDEAALTARIANALERETVRRFYEILRRRSPK